MGILSGNAKDEPLHEGEVFGIWSYMLANNGLKSLYQLFINHAGDKELISLLKDAVQTIQTEENQTGELLKSNGIGLPPTLPDRPQATAEQIPVGARISDQEIMGILSMNVAQGLVACSMVMGQCLREDVGMMFGQFHAAKALMGAKVLRLTKEKGWVVPPPLHSTPEFSKA
ncbi:DUF3231 family protein [Paenisporosarcina cavernae]|uniref:DUF3231 family protein n=1 Tax=Paenisporosarcina cavernae TaxID=2320858 RepID=A0A385YV01_9BACL|nr:DUF3231 family protein [Paenisporosarcina cavernae]AYC30516.1 DUF3231 family protein [Paenisporosarcina cavernae]